MRRFIALSLLAGLAATGCKTTQPVEVPIIIEAPEVPSCFSISTLQRVEIPAETRTVYGTTSIENGEYDPIERRTSQEIVTRQAEVFYVNEAGAEVTNVCEGDAVMGPVGPAAGEMMPGAGG